LKPVEEAIVQLEVDPEAQLEIALEVVLEAPLVEEVAMQVIARESYDKPVKD
jgi:hypothetical protein